MESLKKFYYKAKIGNRSILELAASVSSKLFHSLYVFTDRMYSKAVRKSFNKKWLKTDQNGADYYDLRGAKLPLLLNDNDLKLLALGVFYDTFLIPCRFNDDHNKSIVDWCEKHLENEGPYGYIDGDFSVTVQ